MTVESTDTSEKEPQTFDHLDLPEALRKALKDVGYTHPTPVQQAALKPAMDGLDLVVQARTGTGKTAAFGLPLLSGRVEANMPKPQALVLAPTRELALQVKAELERLSRHTDLHLCAIYGGAPIGRQIEELDDGAHIVVGTPGRVLDHLERRTLDLSSLRVFVLDECDEMLSMGFLPQISSIWDQLPANHQTLLFSATIPKEVLRIAETRLKRPEMITLSGDHIGALEIQHFVYLSHGDKLDSLLRIIEVEDPESAIVFCNTRDETKRVAKHLQQAGYRTEWLNADLSQGEREKVMAATRASELRFLVCTDVASRGIDISHLTHVINFDFPESSEQYVHRTGRTGRAGKMGTALSLVSPEAIGDLYYLRLKYKIHPVERHLPTSREMETRKEADLVAMLGNQFPILPPSDKFRSLARRLLTHEQYESIVAGLLGRHLSADAPEVASQARRSGDFIARPKIRGTNGSPTKRDETTRAPRQERQRRPNDGAPRSRRSTRQEQQDLGIRYEISDAPLIKEDATEEPVERPHSSERARATDDDTGFVNLFVNVGRRDGATLDVLKGALEGAGAVRDATGRIAIRERHSFVEVRPNVHQQVIDKLNGTTLCGREAVVEAARPRSQRSVES